KMGFYYIALKAEVPIVLAYLDYGKKEIGLTRIFYPTGNEEADLKEIKAFYRDKRGRFPERFAIE
ncbi:MAG TPA: acyltransferase, partial [Candidatus Gallibacteroides avistercoris]|nr:acyltransferase [Candidatus Gallibacteroides avistercoris]